MADRLEFKEKLSGILSAAREQGGKIALEDVELYFEEDRLSQEQIDLVCEYLLAQKIAVTGYVPKSGTVKERKEEPAPLSNEEQSYIEEYLKDIDQMQGKSLAEARMAYYLPKVVDEALKMHHAEIFVGDMIQEGNISLMMALDEYKEEEDEEAVMEAVRAGMQALLESQTETRRQDKKMVERVSELDETIKSMSEELGRKVSVEEVADKLGITEAEIEDILKLAGEEVKDEES